MQLVLLFPASISPVWRDAQPLCVYADRLGKLRQKALFMNYVMSVPVNPAAMYISIPRAWPGKCPLLFDVRSLARWEQEAVKKW